MLKTIEELKLQYKDYSDVNGKIAREVKKGNLYVVRRGIYETDGNTPGEYLTQMICSPSYLSFDYALAYYSLIPEALYNTYTSATYKKNKVKTFTNHFGHYIYTDIPANVFPYGVSYKLTENYSYQIASPEKAICDKLYSAPPISSINDMYQYLFDDLRIDEDMFWQLNMQDLCKLAPLYHSTSLNTLIKIVKKELK